MQRLFGGSSSSRGRALGGGGLGAQVIWLTRVRHLATVKKAAQSSHPLLPIHFSLPLLLPKPASSQLGPSPHIDSAYRRFVSSQAKLSSVSPETISIGGIPLESLSDDLQWSEFLGMAKAKVKKSGRRRGEKRAKKDPNAPKRSRSSYMFFAKEIGILVREEFPAAKFGEIGKMLGERWKNLSPEDKMPYDIKAAADKKRYEDEKAVYQQNLDGADNEKEDDDEEDDD